MERAVQSARRIRRTWRFALVGATAAITVTAFAIYHWISAPPTAAAASASTNDPTQALLRRIDTASHEPAFDPTVAQLLHETALALNAQAARSAALETRIATLERGSGRRTGNVLTAPVTQSKTESGGNKLGNANADPSGNNAGQRQHEVQRLIEAGAKETDARALLAFVDEIALQEVEARFRVYRTSRDNSQKSRDAARAQMVELRRLGDLEGQLRDTFGDDAYDRYLYAKELPNRVRVAAVMSGSVADRAGMQAGDVMINYDGHPVRSVDDILRLAAEGSEGEAVDVTTLRGNDRLQINVPRGPLGFRGESASVNPALGGR